MRTLGLSPKVLYGALTAAIAYVVTKYGIHVDPDLAAAIPLGLGSGAGVAAPPGNVVPD